MRHRLLYPSLLLAIFAIPILLAIFVPSAPSPALYGPITGQVVDHHGPVASAQVRLAGEASFVRSDADGRFTLVRRPDRAVVAAWKDGYYIATAPASDQRIQIKLRPLPAVDSDDYQWIDPSADPAGIHNCANCHAEIYREWQGSGHARSVTGRHFQDLYRDLVREHPQGSLVCHSCHAPTARIGESAELTTLAGIPGKGVHCDLCHKITDSGLGEIGFTHGRFGIQTLRPKEGQLFFGPLADASRGEESYLPLYRQSRYCASCHEGTVFGVHVYGTYSEWLNSPAFAQGKQCQDCHMTPTGTMTNIAPGHGGIERDPKTLANHVMFAGSQADMLKQSLKVKVETLRFGGSANARVEVRAEGVGHRLPTGFIDRHLVLAVNGYAGNEEVAASSGPRLPTPAGKGLAGQTGKLYATLLKDNEGKSPAPFWRAAEEPVDTRLLPDVTDLSRYSFPEEVERIRVRLIYRRFWPATAANKGWPDRDLLIVDQSTKVSD